MQLGAGTVLYRRGVVVKLLNCYATGCRYCTVLESRCGKMAELLCSRCRYCGLADCIVKFTNCYLCEVGTCNERIVFWKNNLNLVNKPTPDTQRHYRHERQKRGFYFQAMFLSGCGRTDSETTVRTALSYYCIHSGLHTGTVHCVQRCCCRAGLTKDPL
jgi:hypothetical protein